MKKKKTFNNDDFTFVYDMRTKDVFKVTSDFEYIVLNKPLSEKMGINHISTDMNLHCIYAFSSFNPKAVPYKETFIPITNEKYYDVEVINNCYYISECLHNLELPPASSNTRNIEEKPKTENSLNMTYENTESRVFGMLPFRNNPQLLIKTLGLEKKMKPLFTFLSQLHQFSFDIESHLAIMSDVQDGQKVLKNLHIPMAIAFTGILSPQTVINHIRTFMPQFKGRHISIHTFKKIKLCLQKMRRTDVDDVVTKILHTKYDFYTECFTDLNDFFHKLWSLCDYYHVLTYICTYNFFHQMKKNIFIVKQLRCSLKKYLSSYYIMGYNASKYDNVLLEAYLLPLLIKMNLSRIRIQKKGLSTTSITISIPRNRWNHDTSFKYKNNVSFPFTRYIIFRDMKNIIGTGSLECALKSYGLDLSKYFFPYGFLQLRQEELQNIHAHNILDEKYEHFWYDTLKQKNISIEKRQQMKNLLENDSLLEYLLKYLEQDCTILQHLIINVHRTFLHFEIDYVLARKMTVSQIAFHLFFIQSKMNCLDHIANVDINNESFDNFIKKSILGGYVVCQVAGKIDKNTIINSDMPFQHLNPKIWPSFDKNFIYDQRLMTISGHDIRSLYAASFLMGEFPVYQPCVFARTNDNLNLTYKKTSYCEYFGVMKFIDRWKSLYEGKRTVIAIRHAFTVGGQIRLENSYIDAVIISTNENNDIHFAIYQYNSSYRHGHYPLCPKFTRSAEYEHSLNQERNLNNFLSNKLVPFYSSCDMKCTFTLCYQYDCFNNHTVKRYKPILPHYVKKSYTHEKFVEMIRKNLLKGFIMCKNLKIQEDSCFSGAGFCLQKADIQKKHLSNLTVSNLSQNITFPHSSIVGMHKYLDNQIIHTDLFNWLDSTFHFEDNFSIEFAIMYEHKPFLKDVVSRFLSERKKFKDLLLLKNITPAQKMMYEQKCSALKIITNSCYGFCILNNDSKNYHTLKVQSRKHKIPQGKSASTIKIPINNTVTHFMYEIKKHPNFTMYQRGEIGSAILNISKKIFLFHTYKILRMTDPRLVQYLYSGKILHIFA